MVFQQFKLKPMLTSNINIYSQIEISKEEMNKHISQLNKPKATIQNEEEEQELEIPRLASKSTNKKDDNKVESTTCQTHSKQSQKCYIKYFNLAFMGKDKHKFDRKVFLCQKCYSQLQKRYGISKLQKNIIEKQAFKKIYIEGILTKYTNSKTQSQIYQDNLSLTQAQSKFINETNEIQQKIKNQFQKFRKYIKLTFKTLRQPIEKNNVQQFYKGKFNQSMIQKFVKSWTHVQSYQTFIGVNSKQSIQHSLIQFELNVCQVFSGFQKMLNQCKREIKKTALKFQTQKAVKQNTKDQTNKMVHEQTQRRHQNSFSKKRIDKIQSPSIENVNKYNTLTRNQDLRREKRKEMREGWMSSQSNDQSNQNGEKAKMGKSSDRKKLPTGKNQNKLQKNHIIMKQRGPKPYRVADVQMLRKTYLPAKKDYLIQYIINHVSTQKVGQQTVYHMRRKYFRERYPGAYKKYSYQQYERNI